MTTKTLASLVTLVAWIMIIGLQWQTKSDAFTSFIYIPILMLLVAIPLVLLERVELSDEAKLTRYQTR